MWPQWGFWRAFSSGRHSNKDTTVIVRFAGGNLCEPYRSQQSGSKRGCARTDCRHCTGSAGVAPRTHTPEWAAERVYLIFSYICPLKFAREFLQRNRLRAQPRLCGCWYASTTYGDAGPSLPFCSGDSMPFAADFSAPTGVGTSFTCNILVYIISWYFYL